jgi:hypothetical protein
MLQWILLLLLIVKDKAFPWLREQARAGLELGLGEYN